MTAIATYLNSHQLKNPSLAITDKKNCNNVDQNGVWSSTGCSKQSDN
jgi:hypothetical protein